MSVCRHELGGGGSTLSPNPPPPGNSNPALISCSFHVWPPAYNSTPSPNCGCGRMTSMPCENHSRYLFPERSVLVACRRHLRTNTSRYAQDVVGQRGPHSSTRDNGLASSVDLPAFECALQRFRDGHYLGAVRAVRYFVTRCGNSFVTRCGVS